MGDVEGLKAGLARVSLVAYADWVHGVYPAAHHEVWLREFQGMVEKEGSDRLLIVAPPGHAKSKYTSEVLPPWILGRNPGASVLHLTSTDAMAGLFHSSVERTLREDERHRMVFPEEACRPNPDVWAFEKGLKLRGAKDKDPSYRMAGYGSSVIGLRADWVILDDPLTQKQAQSETDQAAAKAYFDQTVRSRRKPGVKMLAIMTRWHWNDLAAYLVERHKFRVVHMPALGYWDGLGMEGGALWPGYIPREDLLEEAEAIGDEQFQMVYQGVPTRAEGASLSPDSVVDVEWSGEKMRALAASVAQGWDLGFGEKRSSDYTACATVAVDGEGRLYLVDVYEGRVNEAGFEARLNMEALVHRPHMVGIESHAAQKWIAQGVDRRTVLPIVAVEVGMASKEARASLFALMVQKGRFHANKRAGWWLRLAQQMREFPHGAHDDVVDAIAIACRLLMQQGVQQVIRTQKVLDVSRGGGHGRGERLKERMARKAAARLATPALGVGPA